MLRNLDTIYYIARSSKNFSTEINFSENIFWFTETPWVMTHVLGLVSFHPQHQQLAP